MTEDCPETIPTYSYQNCIIESCGSYFCGIQQLRTTYLYGTSKSLNHVQPGKSPHPCLCACSDNFSGELQRPSWFVSPVETGKLLDRRKSIAGKFLCKCFFSITMFDYRENHLSLCGCLLDPRNHPGWPSPSFRMKTLNAKSVNMWISSGLNEFQLAIFLI